MDVHASSSLVESVADYEIVRLLGEGNHGCYYLARPPSRLGLDEQFVALKAWETRSVNMRTNAAFVNCVLSRR